MIGGSTFSEVFGSVPAGDPERLANIARAAVRAGLAIVLCKPGEKAPMCTLTARQRVLADKESRAARNRPHACGLNHAFTDPDLVFKTINRMVKTGLVPNLGVELGRSRMVVVDVDSSAELQAFLDARTTNEGPQPRSLTVRSPGKLSRDGETWAHRDGGHFWFTLPEGVSFPPGGGIFKGPGGWVVSWADHQVLVPPSSRSEGAYELISEPEPLPEWLRALVYEIAIARDTKRKERATAVIDSDDPIEVWSISTPWADLLEPDGWTDSGQIDNCSCPVWSAPGVHAHYKSATAHDLGCGQFDVSTGWGPLHVWTDNPETAGIEGGRTYTKLQYVAAREHDGSQLSAMKALGLASGSVTPQLSDFDPTGRNDSLSVNPPTIEGLPEVVDPFASAGSVEPEALPVDPIADLISTWLASADLDSIPDPEPIVADVLDLDTLARVIGKSGHGKSFVMIDIACCVATGRPWHGHQVKQGLVVYMVAEGARGFKKRIRAWEARYNGGVPIDRSALRVIPYPMQVTDDKRWRVLRGALKQLGSTLVVMDTQARVTVGVNENDATEVGNVIEQLERVRRDTGACTVLVHHLGHQGEHGRGSTALLGALNTEVRVTKLKREVSVHCDKQKDEGEFEPVKLVMVDEGASVVLTLADGSDPFTSAPAPDINGKLSDVIPWVLWQFGKVTGLSQTQARAVIGEQRGGKVPSKGAMHQAWNVCLSAGTAVYTMGAGGKATERCVSAPGLAESMGWQRQ